MARYDHKADPLRAFRIQRRQGGPATYEVETCRVCGAHYRPRAYGAHAKTPAHKKALK